MRSILFVDKSEDKYYIHGKVNKYTKSQWLLSLGIDPDMYISKIQSVDNSEETGVYCDSFMCRVNYNDIVITMLINPLFTNLACQNSDIIISNVPISDKNCPKVRVIDRFDIWRGGAT